MMPFFQSWIGRRLINLSVTFV